MSTFCFIMKQKSCNCINPPSAIFTSFVYNTVLSTILLKNLKKFRITFQNLSLYYQTVF